MGRVLASLALGFGQLFDGAVLRVLLKSIAVTLLLFVLVAVGGWYGLDWLFAWLGLTSGSVIGGDALREGLSLLLVLAGLWLTWRMVAMAVVQFYADEVVVAVERRHYPDQADIARQLSFAEEARKAAGSAGRALIANLLAVPVALVLLFTAIGPFVVFWLVNAVLAGRELQDMVWLRHRQSEGEAAPLSRLERFVLGGAVAALLAIPFANFLAPVWGAASATHLVHRRVNAGARV